MAVRGIQHISLTTLAALLALAALPARAAAQEPKRCEECIAALSAAERRQYEAQAERISAQIAELMRQRSEPELRAALLQMDSVLRHVRVDELPASKAFDRMQHALMRASAEAGNDSELRLLSRQLASLETRLALAERARRPAPSGYLGVTFSGGLQQRAKKGQVFISHEEYPAIIAVEADGPAAKAGVRRGDTLLAYGSHDVVRDGAISLTQLLRPGARVPLRLRRDGHERVVSVTVGERQQRFKTVVVEPEAYAWTMLDPMPPGVPAPPAPVATPEPRPAASARTRVRVLAPTPPATPDPSFIFVPATSGTAVVAGAELTRMNEDLREVFGTGRGVLVLNVAPGSPAAQAGLRGGDVIVTADGRGVVTPTGFRSALLRAREESPRQVKLEVVRKKKTKTVVLAW